MKYTKLKTQITGLMENIEGANAVKTVCSVSSNVIQSTKTLVGENIFNKGAMAILGATLVGTVLFQPNALPVNAQSSLPQIQDDSALFEETRIKIEIEENDEIYNFFQDVTIENLSIMDSNGERIEKGELFFEILSKIENGNYAEVVDIMFEKELIIGVVERIENPLSRTVAFTENFNHLASHLTTSTDGQWRLESLTRLSGSVTFNANGTLTHHGNPSLTLISAHMGANWTTRLNNVSTSVTASNNNRSLSFAANFSIEASFSHSGVTFFTPRFTNMRHTRAF